MRSMIRSALYILACLIVFSCGKQVPAVKVSVRPIEDLKGLHPRLILTAEVQKNLKSRLTTTHQWLWDRYLQELPSKLASAKEPLGQELNRGHGDRAPDLCFAWMMTGDPAIYEVARNYLLALARGPEWDPTNDLVHGHLLQGMALAYDWLYPSLTVEERSVVAERLGREAKSEYERMTTGRVWYHNQYFQNHGISNFCGISYAAAALYGENPQAAEWLKIGEDFFKVVFETFPRDGTSLEGLSYGAYDFEYILRFAELSRTLLGNDYYDTAGLKEIPKFLLYSLLPRSTEAEWAMTFGDAPRHANWHGPEPQLFLLASKYNDSAAQWLGKFLINLRSEGLASASWWSILWYDPAVAAADPAQFPTFHHFQENDQVMMRSAWNDTLAMMVGFKCGPFMGRVQSKTAEWDWGTNHQDPDAGSFQIFAKGQFLAIDPLYTSFKRTANHNTMLFKNRGQLGEDVQWFAVAEALYFRHYPEIVHAVSDSVCDYVVGDVTRAYHPALGLKKFVRHLLFIKPDILIVADQISIDDKGVLYSYPSETLKPEGGLEHSREGYVVGPQGEAVVIFDGVPGTYKLTANYLDNFPGQGQYSFEVDGKTVSSWQTTSQVSDNQFIVSPDVALKKGSRIAFRANSMPKNCRLIKMTAFSSEVTFPVSGPQFVEHKKGHKMPAPRWDIQWLLHFDPRAEINEKGFPFSVTLGDACLDLHFTQPTEMLGLKVETITVKKPHEMFKETKRLSISPRIYNGEGQILMLMHVRAKNEPSISSFGFSGSQNEVTIHYGIKDKSMVVVLNLEKRQFKIVR